MSPEAELPPFVHHCVPNRSLGARGRRWFLAALIATTFAVATLATIFGAWPVMPFAGLEVALVVLAFHVVRAHDADFERLEIGEHEVRIEARVAASLTCFVAQREWARVVVRERGARCTLRLAYAGRTVPLGRLLSDEGRRRLAGELRGRIAVTAN
jgi:uncharacterized membrane protein